MKTYKRLFLWILIAATSFPTSPARPAARASGASEAAAEYHTLPVLMYHSVLKNGKSPYIVTPETLDGDLKYLHSRGYRTVLPRDLLAYAAGGSLPDKPVMITFDDGHYNNLFTRGRYWNGIPSARC